MEIQQLRYFMEVVRQKSVSKAAESLFISRQTVSGAINLLEDELGYPLLIRKKQGVELTNSGLLFYHRIETLFEEFDHLEKDMKDHAGDYKLNIKIGLVTGQTTEHVEVFERWALEHPQYKVQLIFCRGKEGTEKLKTGEFHFVFTGMPSMGSPYYESQLVKQSPLLVAVHEDNPLAGKDAISYDDLKKSTILSTTLGYDQWEYNGEKWMPNNANFNYIMADDSGYMFSLLTNNKGILLTPANSIAASLKNVRLIPLEDPSYSAPYFLRTSNHTLKNRTYDIVVRDLEQYLKKNLP